MSLEDSLLETLRKIEALHAGTTFDGERDASRQAAERIRARIAELRGQEQDEELRYSLTDPWKRQLFLALCRRYGLRPFRRQGQRASSIQVRAPRTFQLKTLWPEYLALAAGLHDHLAAVTERAVRAAIHEDVTEAPQASERAALPAASQPPAGNSAGPPPGGKSTP